MEADDLAQLGHAVGEQGRHLLVGREVDQVAGEVRRLGAGVGGDEGDVERVGVAGRGPGGEREAGRRIGRLVGVEAVGPQAGALDERLGDVRVVRGERDHDAPGVDRSGGLHGRGRGGAPGVDAADLRNVDDDEAARAVARPQQDRGARGRAGVGERVGDGVAEGVGEGVGGAASPRTGTRRASASTPARGPSRRSVWKGIVREESRDQQAARRAEGTPRDTEGTLLSAERTLLSTEGTLLSTEEILLNAEGTLSSAEEALSSAERSLQRAERAERLTMNAVIPAHAGIQGLQQRATPLWIPASAGMTAKMGHRVLVIVSL